MSRAIPSVAASAVLLATIVSGAIVRAEELAVTVFAAASLAEAFRAAGDAFRAAHADLRPEFNFAGSSTLAQQIEQGAPADVFASADEANMQRLVEKALASAPLVFAQNRLAIVVAPGNPKRLARLADLGAPGLVVALCAPAVPAGRYAAEAFGKAGVAVPTASQEADVKAVVTKVALGEADAGVAYVTDARAASGKVDMVAIPDAHNPVARYPIAVLRDAPNAGAGRVFVEFIRSDAGQAILARFGFARP